MVMRWLALPGTLLVVALASSCSGDDPSPAATPSEPPSVKVSSTAVPAAAAAQPVRPGQTNPVEDTPHLPSAMYETLAVVANFDGEDGTRIDQVSDSGWVVVRKHQAVLNPTGPGELYLRNLDDPQAEPERVDLLDVSAGQQVVGVDFDGEYVVWQQGASTDLSRQEWTMYAYHRASGVTSQIAESAPMADGSEAVAPPGWTGPVLDDGRVHWAQVSGRPGRQRVDIMGCDLDACTPKLELAGAAYPAAAAGVVYGIQAPVFAGRESATPATLVALERDGVEPRELKEIVGQGGDTSITGLAASDSTVAWTAGVRARISSTGGSPSAAVMELSSGRVTVFEGIGGGSYGTPTVVERGVLWAETSGTSPEELGGYLYDRETAKVYALGTTSGLYQIQGAGSILVWQKDSSMGSVGDKIKTVIARLN